MTLLPIQNRSDLVKHKESAAVLSADLQAFHAHLNKRKEAKENAIKMKSMSDRIDYLESALMTLMTTINKNNQS